MFEVLESTHSSANVTALLTSVDVNDTSLCPASPPKLVGPIRVWMDGPPMEKIESLYKEDVEKGGHGKPDDCIARHKVAIVVPYR